MKLSLLNSLVLVLSLAMQGVSFASADCSMPIEKESIVMSMDDHANHDMMMDSSENDSHNCCEENCECVMATGQIAITPLKPSLKAFINKGQILKFSSKFISPGFPNSIYRPPSFA
ncbi:hypothetical protein [Marinicella sp. W31]|uniref:hypothetical protein n=1 Tax=Marinicella sp. W31 TaxID=3023713 RepID=UPI0037568599